MTDREEKWARRLREELRVLRALARHSQVRFHKCPACDAVENIEGFVNDAEQEMAELRADLAESLFPASPAVVVPRQEKDQ